MRAAAASLPPEAKQPAQWDSIGSEDVIAFCLIFPSLEMIEV